MPAAKSPARKSPYRTRQSLGGSAPSSAKASTSNSSNNASTPSKPTHLKVLFYAPNLIGYLRVVAMLASFYYGVQAKAPWAYTILPYFLGFVLDAVDGYAARALKQASNFGAILDMVTDRTATAGLVALNLTVETNELYKFGWIALIVLDISSHWFHCISSKGHHKAASCLKNRSIILRWYYGIKPLFFSCCVGQEIFYLANFILKKQPNYGLIKKAPTWLPAAFKTFFPLHLLQKLWQLSLVLGAMKQVVNFAQLFSASHALVDEDVKKAK